jgi:hypothetical protein
MCLLQHVPGLAWRVFSFCTWSGQVNQVLMAGFCGCGTSTPEAFRGFLFYPFTSGIAIRSRFILVVWE